MKKRVCVIAGLVLFVTGGLLIGLTLSAKGNQDFTAPVHGSVWAGIECPEGGWIGGEVHTAVMDALGFELRSGADLYGAKNFTIGTGLRIDRGCFAGGFGAGAVGYGLGAIDEWHFKVYGWAELRTWAVSAKTTADVTEDGNYGVVTMSGDFFRNEFIGADSIYRMSETPYGSYEEVRGNLSVSVVQLLFCEKWKSEDIRAYAGWREFEVHGSNLANFYKGNWSGPVLGAKFVAPNWGSSLETQFLFKTDQWSSDVFVPRVVLSGFYAW